MESRKSPRTLISKPEVMEVGQSENEEFQRNVAVELQRTQHLSGGKKDPSDDHHCVVLRMECKFGVNKTRGDKAMAVDRAEDKASDALGKKKMKKQNQTVKGAKDWMAPRDPSNFF